MRVRRHPDGRLRCAWCTTDPLYVDYHDREWGVPLRADRALFEMLCLEGAQAGLSWLTILRKREHYRRAFDGFDPELMARYDARRRRRLLADPGIVRNRLKVDAFIANARAYLALGAAPGDFTRYVWGFTDGRTVKRRPLELRDIAATSRESEAMSRDLKRRGFRFVGSTVCHAFMQAVGIFDEHQRNCWVTKPRLPRSLAVLGAAALVLATLFPAAQAAGADRAAGATQSASQSASESATQGTSHVKSAFRTLDVFDLDWVADPQVSPDGKRIAYVRRRMDLRSDRPRGEIWMIDADGSHAEPLSSASDTSAPRWSPDGERIAYVGRGESDSAQLFVYWLRSHVTTAITHFTEAPASLAWSPDGRYIAFTLPVPMERKPLKVELPEAPTGVSWAAPPKLIDRMVFRVDGEGYLPNMYRQVLVVAANGGPARQLTHGDYDHGDTPSWSRDSASLFISANRHDDADFRPLDTEIYRIDLADGSIHALTDRRGPDENPQVSPDGRRIAYLGFDDRLLAYQGREVYLMDADGAHPRSLTPTLDRDVELVRWRADGQGLYILYADHGMLTLATLDLEGRRRVLVSDVGGADVTRPYSGGAFSVGKDGRFAYTRGSPYAPPALATGTRAEDVRTLLSPSDALLEQRELARLAPMRFEAAFDHRPIEAWILTPPGFDPHRRYPLVLEIHGGPFASYGPTFAAEPELYAAAGYVVLYLNPRGSTSYGEEFANLIHHDYPGHDFDDLMSGVDAVLARGYVDPERLFVTGGSGGGVLTAWIVGHTDRFRAAVVVKPVINWTSFVLTADMTNYFYKYWFQGYPWDDLDGYWKHSPLAYAGRVTTPTMLMTGEVDYRTPSSEAEQFYEALKLRKIDTALVRVPNASHDISARPSLLIAKVSYILAWFAAHEVPGREPSPADATRKVPAP